MTRTRPPNDLPARPALIVELVGLAGAGKTTLARALSERKPQAGFALAPDLRLRRVDHMPRFVASALLLAPDLVRYRSGQPRLTWEEIKAMAYLRGWSGTLRRQARDDLRALLLDHGPIFKMAMLQFDSSRLQAARYAPWWARVSLEWAETLNLVVWLHSPMEMLVARINQRTQRHPVKGKRETEARAFLTRYQEVYDQLFKLLAMLDGPPVVALDTSSTSVEELADRVVGVVERVRAEPRKPALRMV